MDENETKRAPRRPFNTRDVPRAVYVIYNRFDRITDRVFESRAISVGRVLIFEPVVFATFN